MIRFYSLICLRYAFSKYKGQRTTNILIIIGLALGLAAFIVISGIMNSLQSFQIDGLKNIQSFDINVKSAVLTPEDIKRIDGVESAFEYLDTAVLILNKRTGKSMGARVRGLDFDEITNTRLAEYLGIQYNFDSINLSYTLSNLLGASLNQNLDVTFLTEGNTMRIKADTRTLHVSGFYTSSVSEFNRNTAFMDLTLLRQFVGSFNVKTAVYVSGNLGRVQKEILLLDPNAVVVTWKEANNAVYSALLLEKIIMYLFLGFVFVIIGVSLKNSTSRLIRNKSRESAMLRALGLKKSGITFIFLLQGLIILFLSEFLGTILGIIIQINIQSILNIIDSVIRFITGKGTILGTFPFSTNISVMEIVVSCVTIFGLGFLFMLRSCRILNKTEIMEVIFNAPS